MAILVGSERVSGELFPVFILHALRCDRDGSFKTALGEGIGEGTTCGAYVTNRVVTGLQKTCV